MYVISCNSDYKYYLNYYNNYKHVPSDRITNKSSDLTTTQVTTKDLFTTSSTKANPTEIASPVDPVVAVTDMTKLSAVTNKFEKR